MVWLANGWPCRVPQESGCRCRQWWRRRRPRIRAEKFPCSSASVGSVRRCGDSWRSSERNSMPVKKNSLFLTIGPPSAAAVVVEVFLGLDPVAVGVPRREVIRRVELVVPVGLEQAAAEPVRAALGHDVDRRAGVASLVGGEVRRLDRDLIDEVDADVVDHAGVRPRVQVEAAVDRQAVAVAAVAVDDGAAGAEPGHRRHLVVVGGRRRESARPVRDSCGPKRQRAAPVSPSTTRRFAGGPVHGVAAHRFDGHHLGERPDAQTKSAVMRPSAASTNPVFSVLRKPCSSAATV